MIVNVSKAKAQLSQLIDRAVHGEKVVIAKNNLPLVELVRHESGGRRPFGLLKGKLDVPDDFDDESEEINNMFYGNDQ